MTTCSTSNCSNTCNVQLYPWFTVHYVEPLKLDKILLCKAERQYLLIFQVSRYCLLSLQRRVLAKGYWARIPAGSNICHRGCAYTVLETVQRPGVYNAVYGTVHYKEPLKSLDKSKAWYLLVSPVSLLQIVTLTDIPSVGIVPSTIVQMLYKCFVFAGLQRKIGHSPDTGIPLVTCHIPSLSSAIVIHIISQIRKIFVYRSSNTTCLC